MSDLSSPILDYSSPEKLNPTQDEKNVALLSHVLTLVAGFLAPLIIYIVKNNESEFVREHSVESLNFQISVFLYALACIPLMFILIGFFLLVVLAFFAFVVVIIATIKASEGKEYRYPLTLRLIK